MSYMLYADIFDNLWEAGRHQEALEVYYHVGRFFERAKLVGRYYESKELYDQAMAEYEFLVESYMQISDQFLPFPGGPVELYLLGIWLEKTEPLKAEKYLRLYLEADRFKRESGVVIDYKVEAEEILLRIRENGY